MRITLLRSQNSQIERARRENIVILDGVRMELISTMRLRSGGRILPSIITLGYGQTLRKLGPIMLRRMISEMCTVERR